MVYRAQEGVIQSTYKAVNIWSEIYKASIGLDTWGSFADSLSTGIFVGDVDTIGSDKRLHARGLSGQLSLVELNRITSSMPQIP